MQLSNALFAYGGFALIAWAMITPGLFWLLVAWHVGWFCAEVSESHETRLLIFGTFLIVFCAVLWLTSFTSGALAQLVCEARYGKWQYWAYAFFAIDALFWIKILWSSFPPLSTHNDDDG
ncbi:MAG: hypothetical protein JSS86_08275 [Cyanobacteria bacterium SZAS LIN-2]|nr:hypothetical protein [Cyanobacteria bacterium SZAS LIN-3]MBS1996290.1 hypothetical protein [Cyanobacteria bacterium SZAS LIN-2]